MDEAGSAVQRVEAVSYTHLRAHETGLDLVCRLLLEKKNIITYNYYAVLALETPTTQRTQQLGAHCR
mgnify:CR=1 FL=1